MLKGVQLTDRIKVPTQRIITDAGQMIVPCAFARTGTQLYTAGQLGLVDEDPNKIITVHRTEDEVFDTESMNSFRSAPVTIGHPKDAEGKPISVTIDNASELQVGILEGQPTRDEDLLAGVLVLTDKKAIEVLDEASELSAGYKCDIALVDDKYYQTNIRANHIAIVDKGRAGSSCRISDEADVLIEALEDEAKKEIVDSIGAGSETKVTSTTMLTIMARAISDAHVSLEASNKELSEVNAKVVELAAVVETHDEIIQGKDKEIAEGKVALEDAIKINDEAVVERCEVIDKARFIADLKDFGDKSITDIKTLVIADQLPDLDLKGKDAAYIDARFDVLMEDAEKETPMSRVLREHTSKDVKTEKKVNIVDEARAKMIERQKGNK
jgi:hypothetical protein